MAILKDLIVHGSSRFLNKIYASEILTPLIEAEAGIFKKLKADDATIIGLLDVQGLLHTNSWTNSNIATIDGSFYITPTLTSPSGSVSFISATAATFTGTYSAVSSLYIGNKTSSTVQWSIGSKLLITGEVLVDGEWIPLGTLLAILNANNPTSSMPVIEITDNRHTNPSSIVADIYSRKGNISLNYRNLKISLYQRKYNNYNFPLGIYMTALSQNGKTFLDIYGGVNSTETASYKDSNNNTISNGGFADPNVRIGNLAGIKPITTAAGTFTPQGWGIYTINGYFQGTIVSDSGVIGGWRIGDNSLYNTKSSYNDSKEGLYLGTDYIAGGLGEKWWLKSDGSVKIGAMTLSATGVLSVPAANISGQLTAATIDASKISSGDISSERITTNVLTALQAKLTSLNTNNLSAITANLGTITTGVIKHDTVGGTNGIWLSADTDTSSNITVGESTARKDWRLLVNNKFGVTKTGDLYATSATISGSVTATSGSISGSIVTTGINADNITVGTLNADRIGANSIDASKINVSSISIGNLNGASSYAQKTDVTLAIDNIEVGGRNLILDTATSHSSRTDNALYIGNYMMSDYGKSLMNNTKDYFTLSFDYEILGDYSTASDNSRIYAMINGTSVSPSNAIYIKNSPSTGHYSTTCKMTQEQVDSAAGTCRVRWNGIVEGCTFTIKNYKVEKGTKETSWTPAPEDTLESINNVSTTANTALGQSVWYAECSTAAGTAVKVATVSPITTAFPNPLVNGTTVNVKFTETNSATNTSLKLNVNGTGEKSIKYIYNGAITDIVAGYLKANQMYQFRYDGTYWIVLMMRNTNDDHYDRSLYSVALAASAAISAGRIAVLGVDNKLHLLNTTSFNITCPPLYVATAYTTANVSSAATKTSNYTYWGTAFTLTDTHSIANAVANSNVYIVGTLSGDIFTPTTVVLTCAEPTTENGLYYMLLGRMSTPTKAILQAEHPIYVFKNGQFQKLEATTATNYITQIDNTGIKITPYDKSGNDYLQLNSDAISMYRNNIETLRIEDSAIRVGKANEAHFSLTSSRLTGYGNNNNIYFDVGQGDNTAIQLFYGNGDRTAFEMGPLVKGTSQFPKGIKSVKKDGNTLTETTDYTIQSTSIWYDIYFEEEPAAYSTVTIEYISAYKELLYTVGSSQNITTELQTFPDGHVATHVTLDSQKTFKAKELWVKESGQEEWQLYTEDSQYHVSQINNNYKYYLFVDTGTQIKLVYFILDDPSFVSDPDVLIENYLWDITHQGSLSLTVKNVYGINSVKVNNTNVNYTSEGPLYYDYLVFNTAPTSSEKIEVEFFTRNYNSQYYSTYLNFSNMNKEDSVKGIGAVSFGSENVNKGVFCLVEGTSNTVTGYASHALGYNNVVAGSHAHVGGTNSLALGQNTFVHGDNLQATYLNSAAFGHSNNPDSQLFSIGRGNSENAFSINKDGDIQIGGRLLSGTTYDNRIPLFKVVERTFTAHGIGRNGGMTKVRDITVAGYKPIAILGIVVGNSPGHPTSGQVDASWCVVPRFWIGYDYTNDHSDYKTDSIYYYIWNLFTGTNVPGGVTVDITFKFLYISLTAYMGLTLSQTTS